MRKLLFILLCLHWASLLPAQFVLTYNEQGRLTRMEADPALDHLRIVLPSDADLKAEALNLLRDKCRKTADLLSPASPMYSFYNELWNAADITRMRSELLDIAGGTTPAAGFRFFGDLDSRLPDLNNAVFTTDPAVPTTRLRLLHTNLVNRMLIRYYDTVIDQLPNSAVRSLGLSDYIRMADFIAESYQEIAMELAAARSQATETNRIALLKANQIRNHHNFREIYGLLGAPWFKQWLWYSEGVVRLNPFEFATAGFFNKYPEHDVLKTALYNEYLDTLLRRHIRYDSSERVEVFKKLLKERQNSHTEFAYRERLDKIKAENEQSMKALTTVTTVLNETRFPADAKNHLMPFLYYSADKKLQGTYRTIGRLNVARGTDENAPIPVTDAKKLVVFNVPPGTEVVVREATTPFVDHSEFRQFTDDLSKELTSLVPGLQKAAGVVHTGLASVRSRQNIVVPRLPTTLGDAVATIQDINPWALTESLPSTPDIVEIYLKEIDRFNLNLFDSLKAGNARFIRLLSTVTRRNDPGFSEIISIYNASYDMLYQRTLAQAERDSTLFYHLSNAVVNSTLPVRRLSAAPPAGPLYTTFDKETSTYDDPVTNEVRIMALKGKDSSLIRSFKYRMGKRHRFQLTAGLGYSFPAPVENKAEQVDGTYVVSQTKEDVRVIAGLNFYLARGMFLQNNRISFEPERFSLFTGVSVTDPLKNIYLGVSWDIVPSIRFTGGIHFHNITNYEIKNGQIAREDKSYKPYPFIGLGIDPISFIQTINIFK